MALADMPTSITSERTRDEHIADHNRLHKRTRGTVYSDDYASLQAAANDAATKRRPLVIAPGFYKQNEPLVLRDCLRLDVMAYGATLEPTVDMPCVVEMVDCTRCTWQGGRVKVADDLTIANAIYIYRDTGMASRNLLRDVMVEGGYTVGYRIGAQGDSEQCDHMYFDNIEAFGREAAGQVGIYVGTNVYANCLNHTFRSVMCSGHDTHIVVDATNAYFDGVFLDRATVDIRATTTTLSVRNVRSEEAARFLVTGGPATYPTLLSLEHIQWHGQEIAPDGEWIQTHLAGVLRLRDIDMRHPAVPPLIAASLAAPLAVDVDGYVGNDDLVVTGATLRVRNVVQRAANGSTAQITNP